MLPITLKILAYTTPKDGQTAEQNEDAVAIGANTDRVGIADGASEGWQSGAWANAVAMSFVETPPDPDSFPEWLHETRKFAPKPASTGSWYAEAKQETGAFSTLLGIAFEASKSGVGAKWRAVAVGDSCVFQVRANRLLAKFPIERAADFSNRPALIGTAERSAIPMPEWFAGRTEVGDTFYLLTDALAEWFLRVAEAGGEPWNEWNRLSTATEFAAWIQLLRTTRILKNDDTTSVRIEIQQAF